MPQLKIWDGSNWIEIEGAQGPQGEAGPPGDQGSPGVAASVSVGTTTTGAAGSNASVTNTGTSQSAVLDFTVPRGSQGIKGDKGDTGSAGTNATITGATATGLAAGASPTVTLGGTASARTFAFGLPKGDKGDKGDTGNTGAPGPNPFHIGTSAPSSPANKPIWFDPSP